RPLGDARRLGDVAHGGGTVALAGEQPVGGRLQRLPGGALVRLPAAKRLCHADKYRRRPRQSGAKVSVLTLWRGTAQAGVFTGACTAFAARRSSMPITICEPP